MTEDVARGRGEGSKEAILAAARELFSKRGYQGTSLASIAEAAGLSQPGLVHHYPSKKAVLLAVLTSRDSADWSRSSAQPAAPGIGVLDRLADLVAHNESEPQSVALFSMLLGEAVGVDHPAHEYFARRYEGIRAHITQLLRDGQEEHALAPGIDPEALANVLIAVLDGLQYQWLLDDSVDMRAGYAALAAIIRAAGADGRPGDS